MKKLSPERLAEIRRALASRNRVHVEQKKNGRVCITLLSDNGDLLFSTNTKGDGLALQADDTQMQVLAARDFSLAKYIPIAEVAGKNDKGYANKQRAHMYVRRVLRVTMPAVLGGAQ